MADIGRKAGVVVATVEKRKRVDGKLITTTVKKFASAHDLRRAFGTRWAKRIMPAVLKRLMRHSEIGTTMKFYVTMDADDVADEVWGRDWESGNVRAATLLATIGRNRPPRQKRPPPTYRRKPLKVKALYERRARESNPQPLARHLISSQAANHSRTLRRTS